VGGTFVSVIGQLLNLTWLRIFFLASSDFEGETFFLPSSRASNSAWMALIESIFIGISSLLDLVG